MNSTINASSLPAVGAPLQEGTFAGLITLPSGDHAAVVLLPGRADGVNWEGALMWAEKQGGALPSRAVCALLRSTVASWLAPLLHWTSDSAGEPFAWKCSFESGEQVMYDRTHELSAVAVRLVVLALV